MFQQTSDQLLVIVGGGAAGVYAAIRSKHVAPSMDVIVIEKGKPLSKVCLCFIYSLKFEPISSGK